MESASDLLIQNGKIAQVGRNLAAPAGAKTIDATGKFVLPGIIDPHSHMMADAINVAPSPGKMALSVAVATRSDGAC